jgi:hypothetical protein
MPFAGDSAGSAAPYLTASFACRRLAASKSELLLNFGKGSWNKIATRYRVLRGCLLVSANHV